MPNKTYLMTRIKNKEPVIFKHILFKNLLFYKFIYDRLIEINFSFSVTESRTTSFSIGVEFSFEVTAGFSAGLDAIFDVTGEV